MGSEVQPIQCQNTESGFSRFIIVGQSPVLTINPLMKSKSEYDYFSKWTEGAIETVTITTDQYTIIAPRCQITSVSNADDAGVIRNEITFAPLIDTSTTYQQSPWRIILHSV
jgi:hypothetical protein